MCPNILQVGADVDGGIVIQNVALLHFYTEVQSY